ncbi:YlxM family DNA-binding protein [Defluviitalea phaphyphila]|uniref:YlxM family DNA-binding protein n=1 Tax=Defluviitalea phaphyphila TaxID=1473580 RepID=UPI0007306D65|nr:putative DNA-binding protein [Defluviitalea phaphyphila]
MERILEISLLYDFYGELLTDRQKNIFELYYHNDLSLGEISEQLKISRQGVYDTLRRSEHILFQYEEKLKLVKRFIANKNYIKEILDIVESIEKDLSKEAVIKINRIKAIAHKILNE